MGIASHGLKMAGEKVKKMNTLKPWDGTTPESPHRYDVSSSAHPLYISDEGTIYYIDSSGKLCIWCARVRLRYHLQRLFQIGVIKE